MSSESARTALLVLSGPSARGASAFLPLADLFHPLQPAALAPMASQYMQHQQHYAPQQYGGYQPPPWISQPTLPYAFGPAAADQTSTAPMQPRRYLPPSQAVRRPSPPDSNAAFQTYPMDDSRYAARAETQAPRSRGPVPAAPPPPPPAAAAEPQCIKCSSCSEAVDVDRLGDHVCQPSRNLRSLRVDVPPADRNRDWAAPTSAGLRVMNPDRPGKCYGPNSSARQRTDFVATDPSPSHDVLPRTPLSARSQPPSSPAPSPAPSASRLPFFEKYQKLVHTSGSINEAAAAAGQVGSSIPRSPRLALANLAPPSPAASPLFKNTTMPTSRSEPLLSPPASASQVERKHTLPRDKSSSPAAPEAYEQDLPAREGLHPVPSLSKSRSRAQLVESTYLAYAFLDDDDDDYDDASRYAESSRHDSLEWSNLKTIRASHSSPAGLSTAAASLDACLADLQLLADDEDHRVGAAEAEIGDMAYQGERRTPPAAPEADLPKRALTPRTPSPRAPTPRDAPNRRSSPPRSPTCTSCHRTIYDERDVRSAGDGQRFCRPCYAERFLPKCRKCAEPIEGGAVSSSDGKIAGKYHAECFRCFECSAAFPDGEFYV